MPTNDFILKTLNFKDENIKMSDVCEERKVKGVLTKCYFGKLSYIPKVCIHCGTQNTQGVIKKNGTRLTTIVIPKVSECPAQLILKKQRFLCRQCNQTFVAETNVVEKYHRISNNTRLAVINKLVETISIKSISKMYDISTHSVVRIMNQASKHLSARACIQLPEHILIDEFKSVSHIHGKMSFVFCDAETHAICDIVQDRKKQSLKIYFGYYQLSERLKVKTVTMDMYEPYMQLVREMFPNAQIIIDKFHISQAISREINRTRISFMNRIRHTHPRLSTKLKHYWRYVLKPPYLLNAYAYRPYYLFDKWMTPLGVSEYLVSSDETLCHTHHIGHQLIKAVHDNNINTFRQAMEDSKTCKISHGLKRVIRTFTKHDSYINNALKYPMFTNGAIEGINNKIKVIKRIAYGYRNYRNFRNRILLISRLYMPRIKKQAS